MMKNHHSDSWRDKISKPTQHTLNYSTTPTHHAGIAYTTTYMDTYCQNAQVTEQRSLECHATNNAAYQSAYGYCNQDPSVLPVPAGNFTTEM